MEGYDYKNSDDGTPHVDLKEGGNLGVTPRAIREVFDRVGIMNQESEDVNYTISCSFLQIYQEKIYDLLNSSLFKAQNIDIPSLKLKWIDYETYQVENLFTFEIKSFEECMFLFKEGIKNKVMASHRMNHASSRSHTIFSLTVTKTDVNQPDREITSKLQLVDLAGSERLSYVDATDKSQLQKECIEINKSLFTLRQVISSLADKKGSTQVVPYRESKLTCLLNQCLGGNAYCLMIACLTPSDKYIDENLSTLNYASKAKVMTNKPKINDDPKALKMIGLEEQVKSLT